MIGSVTTFGLYSIVVCITETLILRHRLNGNQYVLIIYVVKLLNHKNIFCVISAIRFKLIHNT